MPGRLADHLSLTMKTQAASKPAKDPSLEFAGLVPEKQVRGGSRDGSCVAVILLSRRITTAQSRLTATAPDHVLARLLKAFDNSI